MQKQFKTTCSPSYLLDHHLSDVREIARHIRISHVLDRVCGKHEQKQLFVTRRAYRSMYMSSMAEDSDHEVRLSQVPS